MQNTIAAFGVKGTNNMNNREMRLQKALSQFGICSRRKAEELILSGKVKVNGRPAVLGMKIDPVSDLVQVDGKRVEMGDTQETLYLMLNKPRGYVTTLHDELERRCVTELLQGLRTRVYPIGRLDKNSEGLLLLTNDGAFANAMMHPRNHVPKLYRVTISSAVQEEQIARLCAGVELDGRKTLPAEVRVVSKEPERTVLEITLYEGRNRQIRRMCEELSLPVSRLKRSAVGDVKLGMLAPGSWRFLKADEVTRLMTQAGFTRVQIKQAISSSKATRAVSARPAQAHGRSVQGKLPDAKRAHGGKHPDKQSGTPAGRETHSRFTSDTKHAPPAPFKKEPFRKSEMHKNSFSGKKDNFRKGPDEGGAGRAAKGGKKR